MRFIIFGFCLFLVMAGTSADCDVAKVSSCLETFVRSVTQAAYCRLGNEFINCVSKASRGCSKDIIREIDNAREQIRAMDCEITGSGSNNNLISRTAVVGGALLTAITLRSIYH